MFKKFTAFSEIPSEKQKDALELKDGSFVLPVESEEVARLTTSVENLELTLKKVRQEKSEIEGGKKKAEDALATAQRELEARQAGGQLTDEKVKALLDKWEVEKKNAIEAAVAEAIKPYQPLQERLTKYELDDVLGSQFVASGGTEKRREQAIALAKARGFQLVDGKVVRKVNGEIQPINPSDYFAGDFKQEMPEWYDGSKAAGGGAGGSASKGNGAAGNTGAADRPPTKWTSEERQEYITANGQAAYRKLLDQELVAAATPKAK